MVLKAMRLPKITKDLQPEKRRDPRTEPWSTPESRDEEDEAAVVQNNEKDFMVNLKRGFWKPAKESSSRIRE